MVKHNRTDCITIKSEKDQAPVATPLSTMNTGMNLAPTQA
jgi:hypothetical protein